MAATPPRLDQRRRQSLSALLRRRAELLAIPKALVDRALVRCHGQAVEPVTLEGPVPVAQTASIDDLGGIDLGEVVGKGSGEQPSPGDETESLVDARAAATVPVNIAVAATMPDSGAGVVAPSGSGRRRAGGNSRRQRTGGPVLQPGRIIAGYRIGDILGVGGMGQVYRAHQLSMNRQVAFKVLSPRLASNEAFRNRFVREARNAGRLQHPHLISVHDVGEEEGLLFFSMELVEGESVKRLIKREGRIDEERALVIARQTLEALAYAHDQGVIHRDIKPDNLMLNTSGSVKVADLGLSRLADSNGNPEDDSGLTQSGTMMGTPFYMAPEQGRDARRVDHRSDIYAVGATLYHMVCGQVPFTGSTAMDVLLKAATQDLGFPDPPPSPATQQAIGRLMAKDPDHRPATAREAIALVDRLAVGPTTLTTPGQLAVGVPFWRRLRLWLLAVAIALLVLVLLAAAVAAAMRANRRANLQQAVGEEVRHERFDQALALLDAFAREHPPYQDEIETTRAAVLESWDEHTRRRYGDHLGEIDDLLFAERFAEARQRLDEVVGQPRMRSPWLLGEVERLRQRLGEQEAAARDRWNWRQWLATARVRGLAEGHLGDGTPLVLTRVGHFDLEPSSDRPADLVFGWRFRHPGEGLLIVRAGTSDRQLWLEIGPRSLVVREVVDKAPAIVLGALLMDRRDAFKRRALQRVGPVLNEQEHDGQPTWYWHWRDDGLALAIGQPQTVVAELSLDADQVGLHATWRLPRPGELEALGPLAPAPGP